MLLKCVIKGEGRKGEGRKGEGRKGEGKVSCLFRKRTDTGKAAY
jgi:hypothetical protein